MELKSRISIWFLGNESIRDGAIVIKSTPVDALSQMRLLLPLMKEVTKSITIRGRGFPYFYT